MEKTLKYTYMSNVDYVVIDELTKFRQTKTILNNY
jgi:hypothetical protein